MNTMTHGDYVARISYDDQAGSFHGEVLGMSDVLSFTGRTVDELRASFQATVEDYRALCAEDGVTPEKTWKGKLTLRPSDALRRRLHIAAAMKGASINDLAVQILDEGTREIVGD